MCYTKREVEILISLGPSRRSETALDLSDLQKSRNKHTRVSQSAYSLKGNLLTTSDSWSDDRGSFAWSIGFAIVKTF